MSSEEHQKHADEPASSDHRVRSGEGVGSVVRELNKRIQQQQQPQGNRNSDGAGSGDSDNPNAAG